MDILEKLRSWRPAPLPKGREFERPDQVRRGGAPSPPAQSIGDGQISAPSGGRQGGPPTTVRCPRCENRVPVEPQICERCGFPFICDTTPIDRGRVKRRSVAWKTLLAIGGLLFWLTNAVFVVAGSEAYEGNTVSIVATLTPDDASGIPVSGPRAFVARTQLALGLLKSRAPDFYYRMRQSVTSIDYLNTALIDEHSGKRVSLEGIGAISTPSTGRVQVLVTTAFPSGLDNLVDGDVFSYAGVLVHELRHIELHKAGESPGGWEEEVLCEEAAYAAVKAMQAPGAILARYEMYLRNPHAKQYQSWYEWYEQFE